MEDYVRWNTLLFRLAGAPGAQALEQVEGLWRKIHGDLRPLGLSAAFDSVRLTAQQHGSFTAQNLSAGLTEHESSVAVAVDREHALREQLSNHPAPLLLAQVGTDSEGAQRSVVVLLHLGGLLAQQDVDGLAGTELLASFALQSNNSREHLLGGNCSIPRFRRRDASIAIAARRAGLPKVGEQLHPPTGDRLAQGEHRVKVRAETAAVGQITLRRLDHPALLHDILQPVGQPCGRRQAVTPGPTGLLVVPLDRLRKVEVGDEANIRLVDPHPESDRRDHDHAVFAQKASLVGGPSSGIQTRVVRQRGDAVVDQVLGARFDGCSRQAVHDAGVAIMLGAQQRQQLGLLVVLGHDAVLDVRAVETRHKMPGVLQLQPRGDFGVGGLGGCRGQGDARHGRPALMQHR